jgi:hypothetical protein
MPVKWLNSHVSIGVPEDLYDRIKKHPEVKWAAVAREAIIKYLDMIEKAKEAEQKHEQLGDA